MRENPMRTTIALDDNPIAAAQEYTGVMEMSENGTLTNTTLAKCHFRRRTA
jgi:hypothetical protein